MLHNVALIQRQHPDFEVIPVLKGNAYGHGILKVAEILSCCKCNFLAVDGYFEAAMIREVTNRHVLVMGHILPENVRRLDIKRCSFVVQDIAGLQAFGSLGKPVRIHAELNTGMNRLGLQPAELPDYLQVLRSYPKLQLEGVMTHLADADNEVDETFNAVQSTAFDQQVSRILS
ncbi:MAG: alanine racemase, partial [Candidatus Dormibacteraceae bacterium]